jgi:hypothetical protein
MSDDSKQEGIELSPEDMDKLAEKAADKAVEKMTDVIYKTVGKSVISKVIWIFGVAGTVFMLWLNNTGWFNTPKGH